MSTVRHFPPITSDVHERANNKSTLPLHPIDGGEIDYEDDEMTKATDDAAAHREDMHMIAMSFAAIARAQVDPKAANGKWSQYLTAGAACLALLFSVTGSGWTGRGESDMRNLINLDAQLIQQLKEEQVRERTVSERQELKLREYEVWLQTTREKLADRGWKLPPLPKGD